ncbi:hypothetical protein [Rubritalea profundi]|uniref:SLA1 homology domain-containing protein n=1 Tax=Rubritalea profundi TaxID=1658618 RepID=A0A2S7U013_9BACT|nr:hypothetical protein [Rubritalea profundi]PQJ27920.1 hypothetical protein BSZ32_05000 [Rubritalea profundi]
MKLISLLLIACSCSLLAAEKPTFETLTTEKGDVYHAVTVMTVKPDSIFIMHRDGGRNIKVEDLSADLQKELGIELNDEAKEYRVKVNAARKRQAKADHKAYQEANEKKKAAKLAKETSDREQKLSVNARLKVIQVTDGGLLCKVGWGYESTNRNSKLVTDAFGRTKTVYSKPTKNMNYQMYQDEWILLRGDYKVIDGDIFNATIIEDGVYKYKSVTGSGKTIQAYRLAENIK